VDRTQHAESAKTLPAPPEPGTAEEADQPDTTGIVRFKKIEMKPMTPEEAVDRMDLLGHDFYLFANAETERVNVVYRRRGGGFGLIEPEA